MTIDESVAKLDALCCKFEAFFTGLQSAPEKRTGPYAKARETHPNAGKAWSKHDDEELARLFGDGNAVADLAILLGRTPNGVKLRLERLGLLQREGGAILVTR